MFVASKTVESGNATCSLYHVVFTIKCRRKNVARLFPTSVRIFFRSGGLMNGNKPRGFWAIQIAMFANNIDRVGKFDRFC